jgi:hypothetical protein
MQVPGPENLCDHTSRPPDGSISTYLEIGRQPWDVERVVRFAIAGTSLPEPKVVVTDARPLLTGQLAPSNTKRESTLEVPNANLLAVALQLTPCFPLALPVRHQSDGSHIPLGNDMAATCD